MRVISLNKQETQQQIFLNAKKIFFDYLEKESFDDESNFVFEIRKSVKIVKPMSKLYNSENIELKSAGLFDNSVEDLIGYIDPLGLFWINEGFDFHQDRQINEQLEEYRNSFFEYDPICQWRKDIQIAFSIIFEIFDFELNNNSNSASNSKYIKSIFKHTSQLTKNFNEYFESLQKVIL